MHPRLCHLSRHGQTSASSPISCRVERLERRRRTLRTKRIQSLTRATRENRFVGKKVLLVVRIIELRSKQASNRMGADTVLCPFKTPPCQLSSSLAPILRHFRSECSICVCVPSRICCGSLIEKKVNGAALTLPKKGMVLVVGVRNKARRRLSVSCRGQATVSLVA